MPVERLLVCFGMYSGIVLACDGELIQQRLTADQSDDLYFLIPERLTKTVDNAGIWVFEAQIPDNLEKLGSCDPLDGEFREPTEQELIAAIEGTNPWEQKSTKKKPPSEPS